MHFSRKTVLLVFQFLTIRFSSVILYCFVALMMRSLIKKTFLYVSKSSF